MPDARQKNYAIILLIYCYSNNTFTTNCQSAFVFQVHVCAFAERKVEIGALEASQYIFSGSITELFIQV